MSDSFFDSPSEQSLVKVTIVSKYFAVWSRIMIGALKCNEAKFNRIKGCIAYIDLFAGPGKYKDGSKSTPLFVLEEASKDDKICDRLVIIFNDKDANNVKSLQQVIDEFEHIEKFTHKPTVHNIEVGNDMVKLFEESNLVPTNDLPTLFFVDPFGYKGLSLELINSILKGWGCDCIFFFNYNRVNMGINNPSVESYINALFGDERAKKLREELKHLSPGERELTMVEELSQALKGLATGNAKRFVLPFRFKNATGTKTNHHLIFVTKNFRGYEKMKEIMAKESSRSDQDVPSFEYNRATSRQPLLSNLLRPLDELGDMLLQEFAGKSLKMIEIYEKHCVDTPFIKKNYKNVLWTLFDEGRIDVNRKPRKNTFADDIKGTFPSLSP